MPLYEYRCAECGAKFEKLVRLSEADGTMSCPSCGSVQTRRLVSAFGWSGSGAATGGGGGDCAPSFGGG